MAELWFYHLERSDLAAVLPGLLEKTLERGARALIVCPDMAALERWDGHLWTYREESFLPHGRADAPEPERQPILLSLEEAPLNAAAFLFRLDLKAPERPEEFERILLPFEAGDRDALTRARDVWRASKSAGLALSYWRQNNRGGWEKQS